MWVPVIPKQFVTIRFPRGGPGAVRHPDANDEAFADAYEVGPHTLLCACEASFPNMQQEVEQGKFRLGKKDCAALVYVDYFNDVTTANTASNQILFVGGACFLLKLHDSHQ